MPKDNIAAPDGFDAFAGTDDIPDDVENFLPPVPERRKIEDPTMDPGSPRWNPRKYFSVQPKVTVVIPRSTSDVLGDPSRSKPVIVPVGINGFSIQIEKDRPTNVPQDFADHIVAIGAGYVSERPDDPLEI
jgi:hypothetical protein